MLSRRFQDPQQQLQPISKSSIRKSASVESGSFYIQPDFGFANAYWARGALGFDCNSTISRLQVSSSTTLAKSLGSLGIQVSLEENRGLHVMKSRLVAHI